MLLQMIACDAYKGAKRRKQFQIKQECQTALAPFLLLIFQFAFLYVFVFFLMLNMFCKRSALYYV